MLSTSTMIPEKLRLNAQRVASLTAQTSVCIMDMLLLTEFGPGNITEMISNNKPYSCSNILVLLSPIKITKKKWGGDQELRLGERILELHLIGSTEGKRSFKSLEFLRTFPIHPKHINSLCCDKSQMTSIPKHGLITRKPNKPSENGNNGHII